MGTFLLLMLYPAEPPGMVYADDNPLTLWRACKEELGAFLKDGVTHHGVSDGTSTES